MSVKDKILGLFKRKVVLPITGKEEWQRAEYYDPKGGKKGWICPECNAHVGVHVYINIIDGKRKVTCPVCKNSMEVKK